MVIPVRHGRADSIACATLIVIQSAAMNPSAERMSAEPTVLRATHR